MKSEICEMNMRHLMGGLLSVLLWAGPVLAQINSYTEQKPKSMNEKSTTIEWLMTGAFLIGCLVVSFKPANRSKMK
jgi:hypothetical protein